MKTIHTPGKSCNFGRLDYRLGPAAGAFFAAVALALTGNARAEKQSAPIPFPELGARAAADYQGEALSIRATAEGARLRCGFQKLEAHATAEGLWLESTAPGGGKFRLVAVAVGRDPESGRASPRAQMAPGSLGNGVDAEVCVGSQGSRGLWADRSSGLARTLALPGTGKVEVEGKVVRWVRDGLAEEYAVSVDGVRQDFVVTAKPPGEGELQVGLSVSGARVEARPGGAWLVLEPSGREIAYSRLRATDATGRELPARMEVVGRDGFHSVPQMNGDAVERVPTGLAVVVDDAEAIYPVRIDPTFSDADWVSLNGLPGADNTVCAVVADGAGNVYIGGFFTVVGTVVAHNVAKWDGSAWSALGEGIMGGDIPNVRALAVSGTNLYAGGEFTKAGGVAATNVAKWNGSAWSALDSGMNSGVSVLAVSGNNLYAGGSFTSAGGVPANYIAKWDGNAWSALSSGVSGDHPRVAALAVSGTNLYAGGWFTNAGGVAANYIAKWDGSGWSGLGSGMDYIVSALAVSGTNLYAGGWFTNAGGVTANCIARWDGKVWSALGEGMGVGTGTWPYTWVNALAVSGTDLYAGGDFTTAGGVPVGCIAKWDGSTWSALGPGVGGYAANVYALAADGLGHLFAGGWFDAAGGAKCIAKWDGNDWSALGSGLNGWVIALAVSGTDLYAGGYFTHAGGVPANFIARWDGSAWSPLGSGMDNVVSALAVSGSDLYAGGSFTMAGGVTANYIAKWDGSAWSALGSGMNDEVSALAVSGTDLYAGGWFTNAGGVTANHIAKWDGSSWSALGAGIVGWPGSLFVLALATNGNDLYAGGSFTTAGRVPANNIAKWDGSAWSALGEGLDDAVFALAASGTNLYAGGWFESAAGTTVQTFGIAKWDGSAWSDLDWGMFGDHWFVYALAVSGTNLYAGGDFTGAGEVPANYLAKWDGSSWSALGSGMDYPVYALAADGFGHLFVGGDFYAAGTNVSPYIAQANVGPMDRPPVADASATRALVISANDTDAKVILDGTRSSDPDGDALAYAWFEAGNPDPLAGGAVGVVVLPVGAHSLSLVVDDGMLTATDAFTVEVLTTAQAVDRLAAAVRADVSRAQPLIATLTAALASIDRSNPVSAINQLLAFQNKVRVQVMPLDPALAASFIQAAQEVIDVLSGGGTNPGGRPHGRFTALAHQPNGHMQMQFSAQPGPVYILEASTNLVDWEMIGVALNHGDGTFEFEDPNAAKSSSRFYRVVSP